MNKRWYYISLAIIIASGPFHQLLLFIIGLLMLSILLLIDIWAKYCLHHLHYQRRLSEQRALYGEQITLSLALENAKLLPLPWVEIEDSVPRALPLLERQLREDLRNNKLLLESVWSIWWYERVTKRYTVRCTARGVHTFYS